MNDDSGTGPDRVKVRPRSEQVTAGGKPATPTAPGPRLSTRPPATQRVHVPTPAQDAQPLLARIGSITSSLRDFAGSVTLPRIKMSALLWSFIAVVVVPGFASIV